MALWRTPGHLNGDTQANLYNHQERHIRLFVIGDKEKSRLLLKHVISEDFANEGYK